MGFALPLIYIIGNSILFSRLFNKDFASVLPFSLIASTLFVYLVGLTFRLSIGVIFIFVISCVAIVYEIILSVRKKKVNRRIFSPELAVFIFAYVFLYFINLNRLFSAWDEFSHWGPMVKEMLRLDTFYTVPESTLFIHKNYPPIISLFESIWNIIIGEYREGYLYRSLQVLSFSFFLPTLSNFKLRWNLNSFLKSSLFIISFFLLVIIVPLEDAHFYTNIYIDAVLAITFAYGLYLVFVFDESLFEWVQLSAVLSFILLIKQIGLVFSLIIMLFFLLRLIFDRKKTLNRTLLYFSLTILIAILMKYSWDLYISQFFITVQFSTSDINLSTFFGIMRGISGEVYQIEAYYNFINALSDTELLNIGLKLNFWMMFSLITFLYSCLVFISRSKWKKIFVTSSIYLLGSLGYAFVLLLLYVFNFGPYEGPRLASFVRYINTYWYSGLMLWFMMFIWIIADSKRDKTQVTIQFLVVLILVTHLTVQRKWLEISPALQANSSVQRYYDDIEIIRKYSDNVGSVFVVAQKSTGHVTNAIRYYIMPQWVNAWYYSLGKPYSDGDVWTAEVDIQTLSDLLLEYRYVYLYEVDRNFRNYYYGLFEDGSYPDNMQLFEVVPQENGLVFLKRIY